MPETSLRHGQHWTADEHQRFLEAKQKMPMAPWSEIARYVGTRTTRQTISHAQKLREKIARREQEEKEKVKEEEINTVPGNADDVKMSCGSPSFVDLDPRNLCDVNTEMLDLQEEDLRMLAEWMNTIEEAVV